MIQSTKKSCPVLEIRAVFLLDDLVDLHPICLFGYLPVVFQNRLETTKQPLTFVETKSALSAFAKNYLDAGGPPPWIRTF